MKYGMLLNFNQRMKLYNLKLINNLKNALKTALSLVYICIKIFVYLMISISAGLGSSKLIQWLNFNMLSNDYLFYASYLICALTFWMLMENKK